MTALKEFERLEATGLWRPTVDAQRVDVVVSLGDASLIVTNQKDVALAHWSLAAVERLNPGERPAIFAPGEDADELLEISDDTMLKAISRVQAAIEKRRPHPGRLRFGLVSSVVAGFFGMAVFWLPGAMINYTASVVPPLKRTAIGQDLLENMLRLAGQPCSVPSSDWALRRLHTRLFPEKPGQIVVVSSGVATAQHLPGRLFVVNRALIEDFETPEVVAGYLLAENLRAREEDPLVRLLRDAGIFASLRLLTTGNLSEAVLTEHAEALLLEEPASLSDDQLLSAFASRSVPATPYAYAVDISGETTFGLIEADPVATATPRLLNDGDWVALQGICGE